MALRKIGVEEELMLVDLDTGELTAVAQKAVRAHQQGSTQAAVGVGIDSDEPGVEQELFLQQIETATAPKDSGRTWSRRCLLGVSPSWTGDPADASRPSRPLRTAVRPACATTGPRPAKQRGEDPVPRDPDLPAMMPAGVGG